PGRPQPCSHTQRILAPACTATAPDLLRFRMQTDPFWLNVSPLRDSGVSLSSGKRPVETESPHSNPIGSHRIRHASGFLQTALSKLPRETAQQLPALCTGQP